MPARLSQTFLSYSIFRSDWHFGPCVLFGRNYEAVRDAYAASTVPCVLHAIFVEGLAVAATTATLNWVIDPMTSYYLFEGLVVVWCMR
ncbi:putative PLAC8 motif-containing protein [Helianthus annuus]|nr:putative PLAC8 motif-containing protein [Helianthus annuus]KAJ0596772.1 putative PLAC8 motif-containing protein [Helianthus annuus]KAJ0757452.1 putative PLAC8 motif-containing protein [Helianthus annuus]KAJ0761150.1 putative PLAC8 motif-containing protein [Helianthus annuus]